MRTLISGVWILAVACSPGTTCPEPTYGGKGSDEAWRSMQDAQARAKKDDAKAITLFAPTAGAKLDAAAPPKFVWTSPLMASAAPLTPAKRGVLAMASDLVYSSAWAHLPPVTGPVHWLKISLPNKTCGVELVTTLTEWTPSTEAWAALKDTKGATLSMDVFSAYLQDNRISEGPYQLTKPVTFSVGP